MNNEFLPLYTYRAENLLCDVFSTVPTIPTMLNFFPIFCVFFPLAVFLFLVVSFCIWYFFFFVFIFMQTNYYERKLTLKKNSKNGKLNGRSEHENSTLNWSEWDRQSNVELKKKNTNKAWLQAFIKEIWLWYKTEHRESARPNEKRNHRKWKE